ncbi:unnamed protein product [Closterium sp. NIES-65]|nr:unnamed protein product [Closterium sp. NIES-65]
MSQSLRCVSSLSPPLHASRRLEAVERPRHAGSGGATPARWKRWSDANTWGGKQSLLSCAWRKELKAGYLTLFFPILRSLRCSSTRMEAVERPQHVGKAVFQRVALPPGRAWVGVWQEDDSLTWSYLSACLRRLEAVERSQHVGKAVATPLGQEAQGVALPPGCAGTRAAAVAGCDYTVCASALFPLSPSSPSLCGAAILLDVTDVRVGKPKIKGWLKYFHLLSHPHPLMPACLSRCRLSASSSSWCM